MVPTPLMPHEEELLGALATMSQVQAAAHFGMTRAGYQFQVYAIRKRCRISGGTIGPITQTIRQWYAGTRAFSRLRGKHLAYAKTMIDGNELVRERD